MYTDVVKFLFIIIYTEQNSNIQQILSRKTENS